MSPAPSKAPTAKQLAVLDVLIRHMRTGRRVRLCHQTIAQRAGCSQRTVHNAVVRLQELGAILKTEGGGGYKDKLRSKPIANEYRVKDLAFALVGKTKGSPSTFADMETHSRRECVSRNQKTTGEPVHKQTERQTPQPKAEPATAETTAKASLQKDGDATWRHWVVVPADDPIWLAFKATLKPVHMLGVTQRDLFRVWCRQVRRGADPQRMLDGWRAHLACCEARGSWCKRADNFLAQACYELDWPMPTPEERRDWKDDDNAIMAMAAKYGVTITGYMGHAEAVAAVQAAMRARREGRERATATPMTAEALADVRPEAQVYCAPCERSLRYDEDGNLIES